MAEKDRAAAQEENKPQVRIKKIYLKDVSFETPNSPSIFTLDWKPTFKLEIGHKVTSLAEDLFEIILILTATTKIEDATAYLAEVHQAGIFMLKGNPEQLHRQHNVFCPRILYPYASVAISDLVTKGGFQQLVLQPVDFGALYNQRLQEARENTAPAEIPEHGPS